jgi:hypothetical protein
MFQKLITDSKILSGFSILSPLLTYPPQFFPRVMEHYFDTFWTLPIISARRSQLFELGSLLSFKQVENVVRSCIGLEIPVRNLVD